MIIGSEIYFLRLCIHKLHWDRNRYRIDTGLVLKENRGLWGISWGYDLCHGNAHALWLMRAGGDAWAQPPLPTLLISLHLWGDRRKGGRSTQTNKGSFNPSRLYYLRFYKALWSTNKEVPKQTNTVMVLKTLLSRCSSAYNLKLPWEAWPRSQV